MSSFAPTVNGKVLTGLEWDEEVADAHLVEHDPADLPEPAAQPLVGGVIDIQDDMLVVDLPIRYLEPSGRSLIKALQDGDHHNERYHHTITDPDGAGGLGVRIDIVDTPASRAVVSDWLAGNTFDWPIALRGGFEANSTAPKLKP